MKRLNKAGAFAFAVLATLAAWSCAPKSTPPVIPEMARLDIFDYDPASGLESRIGLMPEKLLEQYRLMDDRPDYSAYKPSAADTALVLEYLRLMPPTVEKIFREKCVGLYFIEGFAGNGMTSWVVDGSGDVYFHVALNPASLKSSLSETLTERERSCFIEEEGWALSVEAGSDYKGLAYALFHEAAHAVDYIEGITPMVEPDFPKEYRHMVRQDGGVFTRKWKSYSQPLKVFDYPGREKLTFYGLGGGPKISISEAPEIYKGLAASPFVSLYGSKSWAEDFAELTAYQLITRKLGQPYRITLTAPGRRRTVIEPMGGPAAERAAGSAALIEKLIY